LAFDSFCFELRGPADRLNAVRERGTNANFDFYRQARACDSRAGDVGTSLVINSRSKGAAAGTMAASGKERPFVIEYYYKTKWGHAEEFLMLFKKNHYPVLKKEIE